MVRLASNRTKLELKLQTISSDKLEGGPSNRTKLELKLAAEQRRVNRRRAF